MWDIITKRKKVNYSWSSSINRANDFGATSTTNNQTRSYKVKG